MKEHKIIGKEILEYSPQFDILVNILLDNVNTPEFKLSLKIINSFTHFSNLIKAIKKEKIFAVFHKLQEVNVKAENFYDTVLYYMEENECPLMLVDIGYQFFGGKIIDRGVVGTDVDWCIKALWNISCYDQGEEYQSFMISLVSVYYRFSSNYTSYIAEIFINFSRSNEFHIVMFKDFIKSTNHDSNFFWSIDSNNYSIYAKLYRSFIIRDTRFCDILPINVVIDYFKDLCLNEIDINDKGNLNIIAFVSLYSSLEMPSYYDYSLSLANIITNFQQDFTFKSKEYYAYFACQIIKVLVPSIGLEKYQELLDFVYEYNQELSDFSYLEFYCFSMNGLYKKCLTCNYLYYGQVLVNSELVKSLLNRINNENPDQLNSIRIFYETFSYLL
jgi:hypothetical protein